jgi:uncharacterized protein YndB with AHSA1/START domain
LSKEAFVDHEFAEGIELGQADSDEAPAIPAVRREAVIEASPDQVWEAIATEEGRERWLEDERCRQIHVEAQQAPERLVWWWSADDGMPTRVELLVSAVADGTRLVVIESAPRFPVASLASSLAALPLAA